MLQSSYNDLIDTLSDFLKFCDEAKNHEMVCSEKLTLEDSATNDELIGAYIVHLRLKETAGT